MGIYIQGLTEALGGSSPAPEEEISAFESVKESISEQILSFEQPDNTVTEAISGARNVAKDIGLPQNKMSVTPPLAGSTMAQEQTDTPTAPIVDFSFLKQVEGVRNDVYVPTSKGQVIESSGATVASGFDLGQHSLRDLKSFGFSSELTAKLKPYLGKKKQAALTFVKANPLKLTNAEVDEINTKVKTKKVAELADKFNLESDTRFRDLPPKIQTAIASVAFQYGDLKKKTPNFWRQVTTGDYEGALKNLRNFGDSYPTRRKKEAILFESGMNESKPAVQVVEHEGKKYQVQDGKLAEYTPEDEIFYDDNGDRFKFVNGKPEKVA